MSELEFWKDLGNIFDAVMDYQKKNVEFNSRFINPWIRLGNVFERQDAVEAYKRATELDPEGAKNWADLGEAHYQNEAIDESVNAYRKAVTLDPEAGWPLGNLALSLVSQGKIEEAIPLYKKSIDLLIEYKDKAVCWNRLGNAYRKLNDYDNATLAFQKSDQLDGNNTGFSDTLDETPANVVVIAPEEILEQMIVEQNAEEAAAEAVAAEIAEEAAPLETTLETQIETAAGEIALAPNMEMIVEEVAQPLSEVTVEEIEEAAIVTEEETPLELHEKKFDVIQVVENVIAKVEQIFAAKEETDEALMTEEVPAEFEAVAEMSEEIFEEEIEPVMEEEFAAEVEAAAEIEESIQEVEEPVMGEETPLVAPAWLVTKTNVEVAPLAEVETQAVESVTTLSAVDMEATVSESAVNMDVVETYTDALTSSSEETVGESADQIAGEDAALIAAQEMIVEDETSAADKSASVEESSAIVNELAYEEYLKDAATPVNNLPDHVDEIHSEAPMTKISENGDVRIAMDTKNAHVWNELGNIYSNAGAYDDAIASYSKAIELDRQFAWPYSNLALAYVHKGRFAEAILLYQRGIELFISDKDKAITWNRLGNVYRRINDYSNAIGAYQTADDLDPENATLSLRSSFSLLGNMQSEPKPAFV